MLHYLLNFLLSAAMRGVRRGRCRSTRRAAYARLAWPRLSPSRPPLCLVCGAPLRARRGRALQPLQVPCRRRFDSARAITRAYRSGGDSSGIDRSSAVAAHHSTAQVRARPVAGDARWPNYLGDAGDRSRRLRRRHSGAASSHAPAVARLQPGGAAAVTRSRDGSTVRSTSPLTRVRSTPPQTARDRAERARNVRRRLSR